MILTQWVFMVMGLMVIASSSDPADPIIEALRIRTPDKAIELLKNMPDPLSSETRAQFKNAMEQLSPQGEWILFLELLAERTGGDGDFLFFLSQACWRAGDVDSAMKWSQKAMDASPRDPSLLYKCAAIARTSGELDEAKRRIERILKEYPDDADAKFLLGSILSQEGKIDDARTLLLKVVDRKPDHFQALYELGKLESQEGRDEEAVRYLQSAVRAYPFFREAYSAMRTPLSRLKRKNDFDKTQRILERTRQWDPNKYNRLRYSFEHAFAISPAASAQLAQELVTVEREDLAKQYLEELLKKNQAGDHLKLLLGQLRFNRKDAEGALELLKDIRDSEIQVSADCQGLKAWSLFVLKRFDECRTILQEYGKKFADSPHFQALEKEMANIAPEAANSVQNKCSNASAANREVPSIRFVDGSEKAGLLGFHHRLGNLDKRWIVDAMGSGAAVGDYDNDGDDDIYFVNGRPLLDAPDPAYRNALYRNDGGVFADVTEIARVGDDGYGMCAVFGDADYDGWLDLFVGNLGFNVFYRNNGDGTFTEATEAAGLKQDGYAAAAAFGDVDGDGDLDLYVGNYVDFDPQRDGDLRANYHGLKVMMGPMAFRAEPDLLYINDGAGHFHEAGKEAGINASEGRAMGASFLDMDLDGDLDLYAANDSTFNHVLRNDGHGHFEDFSFPSGAAVCESGQDGASMGAAVGDVNNDGSFDIMVTSYENEYDVLFVNSGQGEFRERSGPMGLIGATRLLTTWGVGFCDFEADGLLDYYTVNGHTYPQVEELNLGRHYKQGVSIYRNTGSKMEPSAQAVSSITRAIAGRGSALLDYDCDGDIDIVINCIDDSPLLLENVSTRGNWLQVKLQAHSAQSYGARVVARKGERIWTRMVDGGSGYLSQNSSVLHFGFGDVDSIDDITVYWMNHSPQSIASPLLNRLLTITYPRDK